MTSKTIVIIAGEASGDLLGAGLMRALLARDPELNFEGIGGPAMQALGFNSLVPMERLSVMGLVEVLGRLPELLALRRRLIRKYTTRSPLAMIGIDAPDFNLRLETCLKQAGVPTVHYVSPSVWAWREDRVFTVAKACHHVLALLPFEVPYYRKHHIPATFVGHRLADELPGAWDQGQARSQLGLSQDAPVLALLPGSRAMEVKQLGQDFINAARQLQQHYPQLQVVLAAANEARYKQLKALLQATGADANAILIVVQQTRAALAAADAVLVASGTATLETMLFAKPMLVCYRLSALSYRVFKPRLQVPYVSLPNLLAGDVIVEELLQDKVQVDVLVDKMTALLFDAKLRAQQQQAFIKLHDMLACDADEQAADVVCQVIADQSGKGLPYA
ncbi:MAG: lipid-A-disaccharide synthase [Gammaproteobacteria bacterium]|jgi:lipid-A-disaccharide synthase|nr:lipid-A-disaccharide synthase [Gammaproteobacteria bacterium]